MPLIIDKYSRFLNIQPIIQDNVETFGFWRRPKFLDGISNDDLIIYQVTPDRAGRPDKISSDFYETSLLDWIIITYNNTSGIFNWPLTNEVIKVPSPNFILPRIIPTN